MDKQAFISLLKKYLNRDASPEEEEILNRYYESFQTEAPIYHPDMEVEERLLKRIVPYSGRRVSNILRWRIAGVAALFLALIAATIYQSDRKVKEVQNDINWTEISTKAGQRKNIILPDGTQIQMNAESKLYYPTNFNQMKRIVKIEGEVFLDVAHNKTKPFSVVTERMTIQVVGTKFNVRDYQEEGYTQTTLIEGRIAVDIPAAKQSLSLFPSQKLTVADTHSNAQEPPQTTFPQDAVVSGGPQEIIMEKTDTFVETSWVRNVLSFEKTTFSELARELERWYDVDVVFDDPMMRYWHFTATLKANDGINNVLKALSMSRKFQFKKEGRVIRIQ
ncbi:FecR family protein [Sphingobacterium sp. LRF_L2]|uniref:FecR family protein n=1 Tax=Sphingobacterium sp. LRF_L2 TaxID=3369421 RepID=UPI003F646DD9